MKTMNKSEERKVTPELGNTYEVSFGLKVEAFEVSPCEINAFSMLFDGFGWYSVKRCSWFALSMLWLLLQLQLPFPLEFGALKVGSLCTKDFCFLLLIGLFGSICRQTS